MSYSETVNEKTGDVVRSEYKTAERKVDRKEIRSKDETYTTRDKKKVDYEKKAEVKKKDSDKKTHDHEKKENNRSRDRKCEDKKYDEKNLAVSKKPDSKQKTQETKHRERKTGDGHKEKPNDSKQKNENTAKRNERKTEEKKNVNSDDARMRIEKGQMQVGCVAKALESINVNPVALLVSKMIDQQSLVVKLLTEAREKESRKLELMDRGEKCDEILRMKEKVRLLEKQLRSLEMTLEQKVDKFDRFDSITKTESTQTQQYGIDNATNTGIHAEPIEARDVGLRITNAARQRHTCTIF